mgnify:FL=1
MYSIVYSRPPIYLPTHLDNIYEFKMKTMNYIELYNSDSELLEVLEVGNFENNQELEELIVEITTIDENKIDYYKVVDKES